MNAHKLDAKIADVTRRLNRHWRNYERADKAGLTLRALFERVAYRHCQRRYARLSRKADQAARRIDRGEP